MLGECPWCPWQGTGGEGQEGNARSLLGRVRVCQGRREAGWGGARHVTHMGRKRFGEKGRDAMFLCVWKCVCGCGGGGDTLKHIHKFIPFYSIRIYTKQKRNDT